MERVVGHLAPIGKVCLTVLTLKLFPLIPGLVAKNHIGIAVVGAIRRDMAARIGIQTVVTAQRPITLLCEVLPHPGRRATTSIATACDAFQIAVIRVLATTSTRCGQRGVNPVEDTGGIKSGVRPGHWIRITVSPVTQALIGQFTINIFLKTQIFQNGVVINDLLGTTVIALRPLDVLLGNKMLVPLASVVGHTDISSDAHATIRGVGAYADVRIVDRRQYRNGSSHLR